MEESVREAYDIDTRTESKLRNSIETNGDPPSRESHCMSILCIRNEDGRGNADHKYAALVAAIAVAVAQMDMRVPQIAPICGNMIVEKVAGRLWCVGLCFILWTTT